MKIGVITFHFALNYGAVLQAYALQHCLEQMGHEVEIIDYQPAYHLKLYRWAWSRFGLNEQNFRFIMLNRCFAKFRSQYLNTTQLCQSQNEIRKYLSTKDAVICGSDQIWHPRFVHDSAYLLDFVSKDTKRIAYAGSFGLPDVSREYSNLTAPLFIKIDSISVRETSGQRILKNIYGIDAEIVLDPTMLVEDWNSLATLPPFRGNYILTMPVGHSPLIE